MRKYLALLSTLIPLSSSAMFSIRDVDLMEEKKTCVNKIPERFNYK